jgi:hypothetical protein
MSEITEENFGEASNSILREIDHFNNNFGTLSDNRARLNFYTLIRKRLELLKEADHVEYDNLLDIDYIQTKISKFERIENHK